MLSTCISKCTNTNLLLSFLVVTCFTNYCFVVGFFFSFFFLVFLLFYFGCFLKLSVFSL